MRKIIYSIYLVIGYAIIVPWVVLKLVTFGIYVVTTFVIACCNALLLCDLNIVYRQFKKKIRGEFQKLFSY